MNRIVDEAGALATIARLEAAGEPHRVQHAGRVVSWRRFGHGTPLVLVHGGHGNWLHWIRNIPALARQHSVLVPDLPGFGESEDLAGDAHAPDRMQRLVEAVIGSLDTLVGRDTPVDLAGFSFGGLVAAQLAASRPHVRRLALLGSAGHGGARRERRRMVDWRLPEAAARTAALRHNLYAQMLHEERDDPLALAVHRMACERTRFRSKAVSRSPLLEPALQACAAPVLLAWGEHDITAEPAEVGPRLAGGSARRTFRLVRGAGHWVQYERAAEVDALLLRWFERGELERER